MYRKMKTIKTANIVLISLIIASIAVAASDVYTKKHRGTTVDKKQSRREQHGTNVSPLHCLTPAATVATVMLRLNAESDIRIFH